MNYQTDFTGFIRDDGCLCFYLFRLAEMKTGIELSKLQAANLIHLLHYKVPCSYNENRPVLSDETMISLPGIFVWDHPTVVNQALLAMNIHNLKIEYIGRKYMPWEEERGKKSWGTHKGADEVGLQIRTIHGGHFRLPNYEPWEPGTQMIDLKSLRYYRWI